MLGHVPEKELPKLKSRLFIGLPSCSLSEKTVKIINTTDRKKQYVRENLSASNTNLDIVINESVMSLLPYTQCETGVIDSCTAAQSYEHTDQPFSVISLNNPQTHVNRNFSKKCCILHKSITRFTRVQQNNITTRVFPSIMENFCVSSLSFSNPAFGDTLYEDCITLSLIHIWCCRRRG